jgi:hypothetical protein
MAKKHALIIIVHFRPIWNNLPEEAQASFGLRVRAIAKEMGVTATVGYTLTTQGSFLEVWEADDKATLESFRQKLDTLGYKQYYDQVLMMGAREPSWINVTD